MAAEAESNGTANSRAAPGDDGHLFSHAASVVPSRLAPGHPTRFVFPPNSIQWGAPNQGANAEGDLKR